MLKPNLERKIENSISLVLKAIERSAYIDEINVSGWINSFESDKKIFVELEDNLFSWKLFIEFQKRLLEKGIDSEVCMASRATDKHVIVWKKL